MGRIVASLAYTFQSAARTAWSGFRELVGFSTPRAVAMNLSSIIVFLALWPTERLAAVPVRSVWENVFHVKPYSSGMMRSLSRLLHGDATGAWEFNPLSFVVLPLMVGLVLVNAVRWRRGSARRSPEGAPSDPPSRAATAPTRAN